MELKPAASLWKAAGFSKASRYYSVSSELCSRRDVGVNENLPFAAATFFFVVRVNFLGLLLTALLLAVSSKNNVCLQARSKIPRDGNNSSFTFLPGSTFLLKKKTCFTGKSSSSDVT